MNYDSSHIEIAIHQADMLADVKVLALRSKIVRDYVVGILKSMS